MQLITIKNFVEKHSIEESTIRAIITALQIVPVKKDDTTKTRGVKPALYDEQVLLNAIAYIKAFEA